MGKTLKFLATVLICAMLLPGLTAFAAQEEESGEEKVKLSSGVDEDSILDDTVLTSKVENFLAEWEIDPEQISVGYCYTATGDSWYYNGEEWFYPASMYKVPLMMLVAEKEYNGELTQDTEIHGEKLSRVEELILTHSNNDWAHIIREYLGGDDVWREEAKKFAQLKEEDYDPDYLDYCYFSNMYMTQVMETLYYEQERFPNVIDCLLVAEPGEYYKTTLEDQYEIAQKYGSFQDSRGVWFNHCSAIIYTPNPCIVTVMTSNVTKYETIISKLGDILVDYTLQMDAQLESHQQRLEEAAAEEQRLQEEAAAEAQRQREEQQRLEEEQQRQLEEQQAAEAQAQRRKEITSTVLKVAGALAVLAAIVLTVRAILISKWKKARREKERRLAQRARRRETAGEYRRESPGQEPEGSGRAAPEDLRRELPEERGEGPAPRSSRRGEKGSGPRDRGGKYTPRH